MGLFNFLKRDNKNEDIKSVEWYFTEEAKQEWERITKLHHEEMVDAWNHNYNWLDGIIRAHTVKDWLDKQEKRESKERADWPCMFLKRYFIAAGYKEDFIKYSLTPLVCFTANMGVDGDLADAVPYPQLLLAENNPLINIAEKFQKINWTYSKAMLEIIMRYAFNAFCEGLDVSEESWIYVEKNHKDEEGWTISAFDVEMAYNRVRSLAKYKGYLPTFIEND